MADLIGKNIGQYKIVEKIGVGGMATVFKAYQASINRYVAIKILPTQFAHDPNFVKRFTQEAKAIAALEHPHILPVYDFGTEEDLTYMAMRYVEGGTLADLMGQSMSDERVVQIVGNMARALEYAHSQGVVHRDIKPSNILIDQHSEVLLTDFGIAKMMEGSGGTQLTSAGSILGTPEYMSPEQAEGISVDHRSDIYSLGVVLYELLTGQPPYQAKTPLAVVLKHVKEPLSPPHTVNPNVAEPLEQVVLKAMTKDRDQRYQTAAKMEQALKNALREIERTATTTNIPASKTQGLAKPTVAPAKSGGLMGPLFIGGLVVAVLLCVAGVIVLFAFMAVSDEDNGGDGVAGQVTVAGDLFQATEEIEPTPEPTETPLPPTPTEPSVETDLDLPVIDLDEEVLFSDNFDSNENDWFTGEDNDEYGKYVAGVFNGRYRMSQTAAKGVFIWEQLPFGNFDNFVLVVDAIPGESNVNSFGYGLTFRNNTDFDSLYTFEIDDDGFLVSMLSGGEWETLVDYTPMPAINVGKPNQLMVKAVGPSLTFFINGEEAVSIEDDTLQDGSVGMALELYDSGDSATVDFDNLAVYAVSDEELEMLGLKNVGSGIIFEDYFDSDARGWATGEFEDEYSQHEITIEDGQYTLSVTAKQSVYIEKVLPNEEFSDFVLTLEATPHDSDDHYSYGIAFRDNDDAYTYAFEIGNDSLYAILLYDGEWKKLKDWSSTGAIKPGQTNELKVVAAGSTLTFFVNGEELTTLEDDTLSEGKIGLVVDMFEGEQSTTVDFDNLVIRQVGK